MESILAVIKAAEDNKSWKRDWASLETIQRKIFRSAASKEITDTEALKLLDRALGAFTKSGTYLQDWDKNTKAGLG